MHKDIVLNTINMLLVIVFIITALFFLIVAGQNFYLSRKQNDTEQVGKLTMIYAIIYLITSITLFGISFYMINNNQIQYSIQINKMVSPEYIQYN